MILRLKENQIKYSEGGSRKWWRNTVHRLWYYLLFGEGTRDDQGWWGRGGKGEKDEEDKDDEEKPKVEDVGSDKVDDSGKVGNRKMKKIKEKYIYQDELNENKPICMKNLDDITQEEYGEFYKCFPNVGKTAW